MKLTRELIEDLEAADDSMKLYQWMITEDIQDLHPYLEWGWDGFVPGIIYRG